ncbi:uncharacterized protein LOC120357142 [Solenopsis invicta]|uniref:uncharacterized protein LOC120357142 n=1 Tax=Solenopsis invicta TaxID=13686 RepID=UPI00193E9F66|nr:uncharacterized protein LOC120357142 [Solenopsis invicta]
MRSTPSTRNAWSSPPTQQPLRTFFVQFVRNLATLVFPLSPSDSAAVCPAPPESDSDSILSALLSKMSRIETQLRDLSTIKTQLLDLSTIKPQLAALDARLSATSDILTASILDLKTQQDALGRRMDALEMRGPSGDQREFEGIEARLETFERAKLSSELIIFGAGEPPSEALRETVSSIAAAIGVEVAPGDITLCFRIPAKGGRPRPIIVKLTTCDARNQWIAGKRAKGMLDGSDVPGLPPDIIDINERLSPRAREVLGEARRAVREGRLHRSWVLLRLLPLLRAWLLRLMLLLRSLLSNILPRILYSSHFIKFSADLN